MPEAFRLSDSRYPLLWNGLLAGLLVITLYRIGKVFLAIWLHPELMGVDFRAYYDMVQLMVQGENPFGVSQVARWSITPIVFPPQMVLLSPLALGSMAMSQMVFFLLNLVATIALYLYSEKCLLKGDVMPHANTRLICLCLFLNTSPVLLVLAHGQLTNIAYLLFFFSLLMVARRYPNNLKSGHCPNAHFSGCLGIFWQALWFAVALALKYSLFPLLAIVFCVHKRIAVTISAVAIFLVLCMTPQLFLPHLTQLYEGYMQTVWVTVAECGHNTYCSGAGHYLVNFDFLRSDLANTGVKTTLFLVFCLCLWKDRRASGLSVTMLLVSTAITMLLSYHRVYDLTICGLLLIVLMQAAHRRHRWWQVGILIAFLAFLLIPFSMVGIFSFWAGEALGEQAWMYLGRIGGEVRPLPLFGIYTLLLALYAIYLHIVDRESFYP